MSSENPVLFQFPFQLYSSVLMLISSCMLIAVAPDMVFTFRTGCKAITYYSLDLITLRLEFLQDLVRRKDICICVYVGVLGSWFLEYGFSDLFILKPLFKNRYSSNFNQVKEFFLIFQNCHILINSLKRIVSITSMVYGDR